MPVGVAVTLRGDRMWEFVDRLITLALPRVRDFRGVPDRSFDGRGNYTLGVKEQIIFPEIDIDSISRISGLDITFVTTADTDEEAHGAAQGVRHAVRPPRGTGRVTRLPNSHTETITMAKTVSSPARTSAARSSRSTPPSAPS